MVEAVILYGSRARSDGENNSDTDLLGISTEGKIRKPFDSRGISFHVYPLSWLLEQSGQGSLFLLHVTSEAVPVFDPRNLLEDIRNEFEFKLTYKNEIEIGSRIVVAVLNLTEAEFSDKMRARYFWGLRTVIMATAAEKRQPLFASKALENFCGIKGVASHIITRRDATLIDCQNIGRQVLHFLGDIPRGILSVDAADNLRLLKEWGGIAAATAGDIIYGL